MDDAIYLAYLIGVDRNAATVALHTIYAGEDASGSELRSASQMNKGGVDRVLDLLDLGGRVIQS